VPRRSPDLNGFVVVRFKQNALREQLCPFNACSFDDSQDRYGIAVVGMSNT